MVALAISQLGKPYIWDTPVDAADPNPKSFDCSGLTMWCYFHGANIKLNHFTGAQYAELKHRPLDVALPGDLVFFQDHSGAIYHVAMYVGGSKIIEAPEAGIPVRYRTISSSTTDIMKSVGVYAGPQAASGVQSGVLIANAATTGKSSSSSSNFGDMVLSGSFWRRVGMGVLGVALIGAAVKMGM